MLRKLCSAAIGLLLSVPAFAAPTGIYFFGDSLTDIGNVHIVAANASPPRNIPGPPYDPQGRGSNGPLYADVLAQGLGFSATPSLAGGNDFAYGGARTRYGSFGPPTQGILEQVNTFVTQPGPANASALYVLWGGSNNIQDIILGRTTDVYGNPIPNAQQTLGDIATAIGALYADGARKILVPNVPDLTLVPRVAERLDLIALSDPNLAAFLRQQFRSLSIGYNQGLTSLLTGLEGSLGGLDLISFDAFAALDNIVANPAAYGLTNTTSRCYTGDDSNFTGGGTVCANPDEYLWWDGIHPTTVVHAILGQQMLSAIPEPATLLLVALGLALARRPRHSR